MANQRQLALLKKGVKDWNGWREKNPGIQPDLRRADLREATLRGVNFRRADLSEALLVKADLHEADLSGAVLFMANLSGVDFSRAILRGTILLRANLLWASFRGTILSGTILVRADLSGADLKGAILREATLSGATLFGASLSETIFSDTNLAGAKGLDTCIHVGPSTIDYRTLLLSGRLPLEFLRGCGVPSELQDALPNIMAKVKYYHCFISYGEPNWAFARRLRQDLDDRGVSCWLYDKDNRTGERSGKEINTQRGKAEKVVAICSAEAFVRDGFLKEIEEQIEEDPDKLVPISLDDLWKHPGFKVVRGARELKPFLLDRNYADFANLSHKEALERLLRGLERKTVVVAK